MSNKQKREMNWNAALIVSALFAFIAVGALLAVSMSNRDTASGAESTEPAETVSYTLMTDFDSLVGTALTEAYDAASAVPKAYWIPEDAKVAPVPNPQCFGETDDPSTLQWLLDDAAEILDGQDTLFSTDIEIYPGSVVSYYLDESIFVVTWQQLIDRLVYTFSEVKVSHPSQFRRYLANNEYNSDYMYPVSRMSSMTNAVMASSADYYRGRKHGIIVYEGEVKRADYADLVDTCFIDDQGDLILVPAGELIGVEAAQEFVDAHNINFSIAFGPILVKDGVRCEPENYFLGEPNDKYPRAALCQKDKLHYVAVVVNGKDGYWNIPTIRDFAAHIAEFGFLHAYTLDGGRTGTIAMDGKVKNPKSTGERWISDIIYWGTAIGYEAPEATEP